MKRTKVVDALQSTDFGNEILVKGWVRSHRSSKAVDFIALNDGSTIKNIQIVVDPSTIEADKLKSITTGACIGVVGTLVESQGAGQTSEVQSKEIEIYGLCPNDYPMQKKGQSFEYMRQYAHMRLRTNTFGAVMRIRHNMAIAVHKYFHEHGFDIQHILRDGRLKSHDELEREMIHNYLRSRKYHLAEVDLLLGTYSAEEQRHDAYRLKNQEIGYRPILPPFETD